MSKTVKISSVSLIRLLNLMAVSAVYYFFVTLVRAEQIQVTIEGDIDFQRDEFYKDIPSIFRVISEVQNGELVDLASCALKVPEPQETKTQLTKHGFLLSTPVPQESLSKLINNINIIGAGNKVKFEHTFMLKSILPAVHNHEKLARALANKRFKIIVDYTGLLDKMGKNAEVYPNFFTIVLREGLFTDESTLLRLLRNEFASLNAAIANDCNITYVDTTFRPHRSSSFAFYAYPKNFPGAMNPEERKQKMQMTMAEINANYYSFVAKKQKFLEMSSGVLEESDEYKQLKQHLENYVPDHHTMPFLIKHFGFGFKNLNKKQDDFFDVYNLTRDQSQAIYVLRDSYRKWGDNHFTCEVYDVDPRITKNKLIILYDELASKRKMSIGGSEFFYASKDKLSRYDEWLSFLEDSFSPSLLEFLFPDYCKHMTEVTRFQQEESRSYCKF